LSSFNDLVHQLAERVLQRTDLTQELISDTAARLEGVTVRLGELRDLLPQEIAPGVAFDPTHPSLRTPPQIKLEDLAGAGSGGTGYAAVVPGGAAGEAAPGTAEPGTAEPAAPRPEICADDDLAGLSIADLLAEIHSRRLSPVELVERVLARIEALEPRLNAFVTVMADEARRQARALEEELASGRSPRPLHGIPVAIKDNIDVAGVPTTAGSRTRADHVASADATVVARLRQAGAVIIGKTATHEFAFGVTTDTPYHGPVQNPWRPGHTAGGSSGGSGAAVGARIVPAALGTDTGGSIRIPAAACGTVGFKATYGLVSKHGVVPLCWSIDHVGPLAHTVDDAARVLAAIAGPDPLDATTLGPAQAGAVRWDAAGDAGNLSDVRIGLPAGWLDDRVDPGVRARIDEALRALAGLGAQIEEVPYPPPGVMALLNRVLALAEGSAYHARALAARGGDYAPDVRARFELGQFLLAQDYLLALRLRTEMARITHQALDRVTVLVTPTMPITAPPFGQAVRSWGSGQAEAVPDAMIRLTAPFSLIGFPALSVPCGTAGGLPVSIQIVGRPLDEAVLVRIGRAVEQSLGAA